MKIKIKPIRNNLSGETCGFVEVFDPRVVPARPAVVEVPADEKTGYPGIRAQPAFLGTISCIARFYDESGATVGVPVRNDLTALTEAQYTAWSQWPNNIDDDATYFAQCIVQNLGLELAA